MDQKLIYKKNEKLEAIEDRIADILSEAIYTYIIRKGLLKRQEASKKELDIHKQI